MADDDYSERTQSLTQQQPQPQQQPHIHRPIPRRTFEPPPLLHDNTDTADSSPVHAFSQHPHPHSPASLPTSRSSDFLAQLNARLLRTYHARADDATTPESPVDAPGHGHGFGSARLQRQNKSFLNMNSSTLFGIYDDAGAASNGVASIADTPWGTGAETPGHTGMGWQGGVDELSMSMSSSTKSKSKSKAKSNSNPQPKSSPTSSKRTRTRTPHARLFLRFAKLLALFTFGIFYGSIVSHLHDTRQLASIHVAGVDRESWFYVVTWGCAGVVLGSLLPWVDVLWGRGGGEGEASRGNGNGDGEGSNRAKAEQEETEPEPEPETEPESPVSEQINDVVRSVAAFLGIAFAIRRLPWQSPNQITLTLALVNPALWYILDRSKPGLSFSLVVTSLLTGLVFFSGIGIAALDGDLVGVNGGMGRVNGTGVGTSLGTSATGFANPGAGASGTGTGAGFATASASASRAPAGLETATGVPGNGNGNASALPTAYLFAGVISYENLAVVTWVGSVLFCSCVCFGSVGRRLAGVR